MLQRILWFSIFNLLTLTFADASTFNSGCADAGNNSFYMGGAWSPYSLTAQGTVAVDEKKKCKKSFLKGETQDTYTYSCEKDPDTAPDSPYLLPSSNTITIKKQNGVPSEILNAETTLGLDQKPKIDTRSIKYSYTSGTCEIDKKVFTLHMTGPGEKKTITNFVYDKGVCEKINSLPGLDSIDKCSGLIASATNIVNDFEKAANQNLPKNQKVILSDAHQLNQGMWINPDGSAFSLSFGRLAELVQNCRRHGMDEPTLTCATCSNIAANIEADKRGKKAGTSP